MDISETYACKPEPGDRVFETLPGFHYSDAFRIRIAAADGRTLEQLMAARGTGHLEKMLARLRDRLTAPFGLKPIGKAGMAPFETVERHEGEVIFGVGDRHADVRIAYALSGAAGTERTLRATTAVRLNNAFGRVYLMVILPFHFLIVRRQLKRIALACRKMA